MISIFIVDEVKREQSGSRWGVRNGEDGEGLDEHLWIRQEGFFGWAPVQQFVAILDWGTANELVMENGRVV